MVKEKNLQPLRLAFNAVDSEAWTAGPIYMRNMVNCLRQTSGRDIAIQLVELAEGQNKQNGGNEIEGDEVVYYTKPHRWTATWVADSAMKRLLSRDVIMDTILRKHKIQALFGPMLMYPYQHTATLSWLPDFQHLHLPEIFSEEERQYRDRVCLQCARLATRIILPNQTAIRDFDHFAPEYVSKVRAFHPISHIPETIYSSGLDALLRLYHLPEKFVYLPNQFWKHKNHELAFRAVKILKNRGVSICLVCTGNPSDYRHPTYFADLFQQLSQWNIRDEVIYLGLIPHEHVLLLIRQSLCVLNPSLFEGWGITVDEARSIGKRTLLSDIQTHREHNPPKATFFDPYDCDDLAEKLAQIWHHATPGPDVELESEARGDLPRRLRAYGEAFISVAREAVAEVGV